jgi:putative oxidoreductase
MIVASSPTLNHIGHGPSSRFIVAAVTRKESDVSPEVFNAAMAVLRAAIGVVFLAHGLKHLKSREKTMRWAESIGLKSPAIQWMFMTFAEIGIGLGFLAGFLTSFAAAGLVAMMFVAFWTVHRFAGFWVTARPDEGYEYVLVLGAAAIAVALLGPGEWSLDHALEIADDFDGKTGALIVAGGFIASLAQLAAFYRRKP